MFQTLSKAGEAKLKAKAKAPTIPIKKSVSPDFIVCLEDGKKLKMLKRHLKTSYGMTPAQYRAKWVLADSYPRVAPSYASHRSTLAKSIGLGRKSGATAAAVPESAELSEAVGPTMTVGRARKARGSNG